MPDGARIDKALASSLGYAGHAGAPPRLSAALVDAVTPGGARVRPRLCLAVARACGDDAPSVTDAAAAALELVHCASLVHDDLPCFDDAPIRRGKPSIHRAYGEELAVLAGDSLIILAFETLARGAAGAPERANALVLALARAIGMPGGLCAGQGWESESTIDLAAYHGAKTGSLFVAATRMGALAAGRDPDAWSELGARIGEAFQIADDLRDALLDEQELGKPAGQDAAHGRPNAVAQLGVKGAADKLHAALSAAITSIPACPGEAELCQIVRWQAERLVPKALATQSA